MDKYRAPLIMQLQMGKPKLNDTHPKAAQTRGDSASGFAK